MNPREQRFVEEYLIDLNATQAAIRAGYSERGASVTGTRLLARASVSRAIAEGKARRAERLELDADWVLTRLQSVAERCMQAEPVMTFDPVERAMVQAEDGEGHPLYTFDSKGANGALKLLGDHLGLYVKRVETKGEMTVNAQLVDRPPNETREQWLERRRKELGQ